MLDIQASRRTLLKSGGALVVSFMLPGTLALGRSAAAKPLALDQVGTFLAIDRDNMLTVYTGKVDLGTGIRMALMQMAADELDMAIEQTRLIEGDTNQCPDQGVTWSSQSVQTGGMEIRLAAATARKALIGMASERLAAPSQQLQVRDGIVRVAGGGGAITWGELLEGQIIELEVDPEARVKLPHEHRLVGRSLQRPEIPAKVTGTFKFSHNVRVPGMVHARMVFPPGIGSELISVDEESVSDILGLIAIVRINDFLAVVAETEWAAVRARQQLTTEWTEWQGLPDADRLFEHVRDSKAASVDVVEQLEVEGVDTSLDQLPVRLAESFDFGIQIHGSIGPSCAVAQVENGRATVWSASQAPYSTRRELARMLDLDEDQVHFIYAEGAACFGRNGHEDCTLQAALISREVGRPVRLQWMREDEHRWAPVGPPVLVDVEGGLDALGRVAVWTSDHYIPQQSARDAITNLALAHSRLPHTPVQNPGSMHNNAVPGYSFPVAIATLHRLETTPLRPSWFRSPGRMQNTFAIESFMDELAAAADADPVEFRLLHLDDERGVETLLAATRRANWQSRPARQLNAEERVVTGRGVAYARYERRTYISCVADVEVDRESGNIRVVRTVIGQDCGQIINPDGVINQIEGGVIQTVSRTLMEELKFDRANVTTVDWASYPIITFPDVPEVICELIVRQDQPPWGVAEMAMVVVPPAIANAVFDATGVRLRSVPFTPAKVRAALTD